MADYTIAKDLWEQALAEQRAQWRRKSPRVSDALIEHSAHQSLLRSWQCATSHHDRCKPQQLPLNLPEIKGMEDLRQKMLDSNKKNLELIQVNHRAGLIKFFTMENGITQSTAEKIVDECILIH